MLLAVRGFGGAAILEPVSVGCSTTMGLTVATAALGVGATGGWWRDFGELVLRDGGFVANTAALGRSCPC